MLFDATGGRLYYEELWAANCELQPFWISNDFGLGKEDHEDVFAGSVDFLPHDGGITGND